MTYEYNFILISIHDADTVTMDWDLGAGVWKKGEHFRLAHINAPELSTPEGIVSRDKLTAYLSGKKISGKTLKQEKYGRFLIELYADGEYINKWLVDNGLAVFKTY